MVAADALLFDRLGSGRALEEIAAASVSGPAGREGSTRTRTVTVAVAPGARSPTPHDTPRPETEQVPPVAPRTVTPSGSVSVTVAPRPTEGPLLRAVRVKAASVPATTVAWSTAAAIARSAATATPSVAVAASFAVSGSLLSLVIRAATVAAPGGRVGATWASTVIGTSWLRARVPIRHVTV